MPQCSLIDLLLLAMFKTNQPKETMKKEKSLTNDLFGTELICCTNCMGEGEINETPENATYELYEDCDICKGTGEINA